MIFYNSRNVREVLGVVVSLKSFLPVCMSFHYRGNSQGKVSTLDEHEWEYS